jgi:hypothetical protein
LFVVQHPRFSAKGASLLTGERGFGQEKTQKKRKTNTFFRGCCSDAGVVIFFLFKPEYLSFE